MTKETKVSDHAAPDAPNTTVVGTNPGQGQPYENPNDTTVVDEGAERDVAEVGEEQNRMLIDMGIMEGTPSNDEGTPDAKTEK